MNEETSQLIDQLRDEGYYALRELPGRGICGLYRFIFTVGLVYGIDKYGYKGRWCYGDNLEARKALEEWEGAGDPGGNWIKYKGIGGEHKNSLSQKESA